jgi:Prokaryotic RING finger family 1
MEPGDSSLKNWFKKSGREVLALAARLSLVILAALVAGILLLLLYMQNTTIHLIVFDLTASICIGLLAGFLARLILKKSTPALRFLTAAVALLAGLMAMNLISNATLGLSPYIRSAIDWYGLVQVGFGLGAAYIALYGFRRKPAQVEMIVPVATSTNSPASLQPFVVSSAAANVITPVPGKRKSAAKKSKASSKKSADKSKVVVAKKRVSKTVATSKKPRKKVVLAAFDEHRCPYCLEEVRRNDPRGVVICPICKAYHHKDCWDITGRCQVPHDNPL